MAFESVNYQCPACGGPLHFASAEQKLVCDYCDSRFEVEEVEALYRERQDACQECEYGLFERCLHGVLLYRTKPIEANAGVADPPPITR